MTLHYLDFEYSEDADGNGTFDAMASGTAAQVPAIHAELALVLAWAYGQFPNLKGPLDEGWEWDFNLQGMREFTAFETLTFDPHAPGLHVESHPAGAPRHTVTLSITGTPSFCAAFDERFSIGQT